MIENHQLLSRVQLRHFIAAAERHSDCQQQQRGSNPDKGQKIFQFNNRSNSDPAESPYSQAVYDQANKDEEVVALEVLDVLYDTFAQPGDAGWRSDVVCVQEQRPGPDVGPSVLDPLLGLRIAELAQRQLWNSWKFKSAGHKVHRIALLMILDHG